jgi:hypothetical protein
MPALRSTALPWLDSPSGTMTKRETVLSLMHVAGYENDRKAWTRLLVENAIGRAAADEAWTRGVAARQSRS